MVVKLEVISQTKRKLGYNLSNPSFSNLTSDSNLYESINAIQHLIYQNQNWAKI